MTTYPIADIYRTLQGEGHFVGYPMTLVRFAGCSLWGSKTCRIAADCDTEPTAVKKRFTARDIVSVVSELNRHAIGIVLLTGGEPTDYDLVPVVDELVHQGYRVHLETSGQKSVAGLPIEWITVSPKTPTYQQRVGHALKVVVQPGWTWREINAVDEGTNFFHRYLQPLTRIRDVSPDNRDRAEVVETNLAEVTRLLLGAENVGGRWALSTQAHRHWRLP